MSINVKHDSRSELYRMPGGAMPAGACVRMRLWTSRPFRQVFLRTWTDHEQKIPMRALGAYAGGILYEAELLLPSKPGLCWYCFYLRDGGRNYWYGNAYDHLGGMGRVYDEQPPSFQITVYDPAFMPPKWMREGAMYQIFPDRFNRTDIGACGRLKPASARHSEQSPACEGAQCGAYAEGALCSRPGAQTEARADSGRRAADAARSSLHGKALNKAESKPQHTGAPKAAQHASEALEGAESGARHAKAPQAGNQPACAPAGAEGRVSDDGSYEAMCARVHPIEHANWYEKPMLDVSANGDNSARDFFGGNLQGIIAKLDYLKLMGITVIYLNPIFLSPSNHRYNCSDYLRIDPRVGTEDDLRQLCAQAKARGMRIMLDGVFSHTGDDSAYFNRYGTFAGKGACQGKASPYYDWYSFDHFPDKYRCWWGFDTLPEVNEDSPSFRSFICGPDGGSGESPMCKEGVVRHYLRMGVSGWRLDVADELPMDFLAALRRAARHEREDAAILGEVWEDASNKEAYGQVRCYFAGDTLDSVMNYPLRDMAIDFMLGRIGGGEFARRYSSIVENYPKPALYALMNLMGSHDRPRIFNIMAGMDPNMPREKQAEATVPAYASGVAARRVAALWRLICALPGMPCVYYGDEAGARGMGDPFNRGTYPWGYEDEQLRGEFKAALDVRAGSEALRRGSVEMFSPDADVVVVLRRLHDGSDYAGVPSREEAFMAVMNRSLNPATICLDAAMVKGVPGLRRQGDVCVIELPPLTTGYFG